MTEKCGVCKFFIKDRLRPGFGECHKLTPKLFPIQTPQGVTTAGGWPPTKDNDWCGEFKPKTNGEVPWAQVPSV